MSPLRPILLPISKGIRQTKVRRPIRLQAFPTVLTGGLLGVMGTFSHWFRNFNKVDLSFCFTVLRGAARPRWR